MQIVQGQLRHKNYNTTINIYGQVLKEHDQKAVETLSKMRKRQRSVHIYKNSKKKLWRLKPEILLHKDFS